MRSDFSLKYTTLRVLLQSFNHSEGSRPYSSCHWAHFLQMLLLLLFLIFSTLVASPKKTTLHGGQSRSWFAEQGEKEKEKVWQRSPPPARCSFGEKKIYIAYVVRVITRRYKVFKRFSLFSFRNRMEFMRRN